MALRDRVRAVDRSLTPRLFVGAFVIALVQAPMVALAALFWGHAPWLWLGLGFVPASAVVVLLAVVTVPLFVGLYSQLRVETEADGFWSVARRHYADVFVTTAAGLGFAILAGLAGISVVLGIHTAVQFTTYAGGRIVPTDQTAILVAAGAVGLLGSWIAFLATRFGDVLVAFEDRSPWSAWFDSLRYVRRQPRTFLGYCLATTVAAGPYWIGFLLSTRAFTNNPAAAPLVVLTLGPIGIALAATTHVEFYRTSVRPALGGVPTGVPRRRIAVVAVTVLVVLGGTATVRTVDAGFSGTAPDPLPEEATDVPAVAVENTLTTSHRRVFERTNGTNEQQFRTRRVREIDYGDRQLLTTRASPSEDVRPRVFNVEALTYVMFLKERPGGPMVLWPGIRSSGYGNRAPESTNLSLGDAPWRLVAESKSTATFRIDDPGEIAPVLEERRIGYDEPLAEESRVTLVIDRDRGVVDRIAYEVRSRASGNRSTYVERYENVGTHDVRRPTWVGDRSLVDLTWDALYY